MRLCDDFYWWYLKQFLADVARERMKGKGWKAKTINLTRRALRSCGEKEVGFRLDDVVNVARAVAMETHTGMDLDQIAQSPHPLWTTPLSELPAKFFKLAAKDRDLEIAQAVGELVSKQEKPTLVAVAKLIGVSRATINREPCRSYYRKWLRRLSGSEPVSKGRIRSKHTGQFKPTSDAHDETFPDDSDSEK